MYNNIRKTKRKYTLKDFAPEAQLILSEYICCLCKGIFTNPVTDSCGDVYCKLCLYYSINTFNGNCPITNKPLIKDDIKSIKFMDSLLDKQNAFCSNRNLGCFWQGRMLNQQSHLRDECPKSLYYCPECDLKMIRDQIEEHESLCYYRYSTCEDCNENIRLNTDHEDICKKKIIECTCKELIMRCDILEHKNNFCDISIINCIYKDFGCNQKIHRYYLSQHLNSQVSYHLSLLEKLIANTSKKLENLINHNVKQRTIIRYRNNILPTYEQIDKIYIKNMETNIFKSNSKNEITPCLSMILYNEIDLKLNSNEIDSYDHEEELANIRVFTKRNFIFIDYHLNENAIIDNKKTFSLQWKIKIFSSDSWFAFGICSKNLINRGQLMDDKYRLIERNSFLLCKCGLIINPTNENQNFLNINSMAFDIGDVIKVKFLLNKSNNESSLSFKINRKFIFKLTKIMSSDFLIPIILNPDNRNELKFLAYDN